MDYDGGLADWAVDEPGGQTAAIERYFNSLDQAQMAGVQRARDFQATHPPTSLPTAITLSQYLTIQEKGVAAWSFEPDYESLPPILVQARTELTFLADGEGLPPSEGGACSVQTNLPIPRSNDVYYFEAKLFEISPGTTLAFGLSTKPFPSFRLPGTCKYSVAYDSNGQASYNYPFTAHPIGTPLLEGDVLGVGYKPRTGTVFYTRNGKRLDPPPLDGAFHAFGNGSGGNQQRTPSHAQANSEGSNGNPTNSSPLDLFPTVGSTGAAVVHVNFGQAGFVFIEANVKKWGLAPMSGTLAPPPAYGHNNGSLLLETAGGRGGGDENDTQTHDPSRPLTFDERSRLERRVNQGLRREAGGGSRAGAQADESGSEMAGDAGVGTSTVSNDPQSHNLTLSNIRHAPSHHHHKDNQSESLDYTNNPPTPNNLDISLTELERRRSQGAGALTSRREESESGNENENEIGEGEVDGERTPTANTASATHSTPATPCVSSEAPPPHYAPIDPQKYPDGVSLADIPVSTS